VCFCPLWDTYIHLKQLTTENNRSLLYGSVGTQATTNSSTYQLGQIGGQFPKSRSNPFTRYAHTSLPANIRTQQLIYLEPKIVNLILPSPIRRWNKSGLWYWWHAFPGYFLTRTTNIHWPFTTLWYLTLPSCFGIWFWLATAISHLISAVQKWKKTTLTSHLVIKFSSLILMSNLNWIWCCFPSYSCRWNSIKLSSASCIWHSTKHCSLIFTTYWGFLQWYWRKYTAVPDC